MPMVAGFLEAIRAPKTQTTVDQKHTTSEQSYEK
jgi:hypothetical protein